MSGEDRRHDVRRHGKGRRAGEPARVVIVEDARDMGVLLSAIAPLHGIQVAAVLFDHTAVVHHDWSNIHGALVDWNLNGSTGAAVLDWLAEHHSHVRCVVLTGLEQLPTHPHAYAVVNKDHMADALELLTRDP